MPRHPPDRRRTLLPRWIAVGALVALAIVVVAAAAGGGDHRRPHAPARAAARAGGPARRGRPPTVRHERRRSRQRRRLARERRAVAHVLGYTPYVARGSWRRREVALTFDDGPGPYTPRVLRVLERLRVPATFFVVGEQLNSFRAGLRAELRGGFEIGDHTETHPLLSRLGPAAQRRELRDQIARVRRLGAPRPFLFRPPYGAFDRTTLRLARRMGLLMVLWTIDTQDYRRPGAAAIVQAALRGARPGAIVLMHDAGGERSQTIAALPAIVRKLRARHYRLVTVGQLVRDDPPPRHQAPPRSLAGG
jgi:peptidoglycan/xylan/chitin deacetylase (PgdA/CDA1 family)